MLPTDESPQPAPCLALERRQDEPLRDTIHIQTCSQPSSPVFRLPPELFRYIFRILFDMHLQAITAWRRRNDFQINKEMLPQPWRLPQVQHPWIITLQICRLWRWVAMDYGGLWTDITSRWPAPFRIVLPSIEHISVIDEVICMSEYLSYFPLSSHIRHRFTMFDENSPPIANHIRYLAVLYLMSQVSTLIGGPVAYLVFADDIMANCEPFRRLELDAKIDHTSQAYFQPPPLLRLIFDCVSHSDAYLPCFQTVLNGLGGQLSHVNMMWLMDMDAYMCIDWSRLLARMFTLREVILSTDYPDPIVELMGSVAAEHCDERTGITEREVYLPALEHLRVSMRNRDEELIELVAHSLERRMDLGSRLPMLTMNIESGDALQTDDEMLLSRVVSSLVDENET